MSGSTSGHGARRRLYPEQITSAYTQPNAQAGAPPLPSSAGYPPNAAPSQITQAPQFFVPGEAPAAPVPNPGHQRSPASPGYAAQDPMASLSNQFGNMGFSGAHNAGAASALLAGPPEIWTLEQPLPPVVLPPQTAATPHYVPCDGKHMRSTLNCVPNSASLLKKSKLLFGITFTPFKTDDEGESPLPVVHDIVRCRRCRTYLNPYVRFTDGGYKWLCNLCNLKNEVPAFFDYDAYQQVPVDRFQRPELSHSVVEYVAPAQYMSRPPQPPVYVFIIDVSHDAVKNGSIGVMAQAILESLDRIPNTDGRAMVCFITVDSALHFYSLTPEGTEPQMLVVPDLDDPFLPYPNQLLVNLSECRPAIDALLSRLGEMFLGTTATGFALGPALQSAKRLIQHIGGKIIVCHSALPNIKAGALKNREDVKAAGTAKESDLLKPADPFYSSFIQQVLGLQITVDFFVFASGYVDLASLAPLARTSGGSIYMYPGFLSTRPEDVNQVMSEMKRFLSRDNGWEAVFRIRASPGIRFPAYYGHHFLRSTDLLALPNVSPDHCYAADVALENDLAGPVAFFQSALLYTSSNGERRIRVATLALPIVSQVRDLFRGIDQVAVAALLAKKAADRVLSAKLEDARKAVEFKTVDMLNVDRAELGLINGTLGQIPVPRSLNLLPLLTLGILKGDALRSATGVHHPSDLRTAALAQVLTLPPEILQTYLLAKFYPLHELSPEAGLPSDQAPNLTQLPPPLNLSSEKLARHGVFLLYSVTEQYVWMGRDAHPNLLRDLFSVGSYNELTSGPLRLPQLDTDISRRVHAILARLAALTRHAFAPTLQLVKEDAPAQLRSQFHAHLVEDKNMNMMSYQQFLGFIREKMQ
ncbi:Sec23/Sec24 trunk domain-containing protein [Dimargaris cristalligena]|uniref:Sec23/Sec24 trunk domain-containing protein n=1 Tax=Dimargaris cristalligena TaxID=215637 RepID=A0A4P9ZV10_9FUNG|nr:Sec23/Sec24 trunk domain-containing protein [Dimargaris cristalligena]|eukprot:RKP36450.1 Sec23/Sec24 trunk domain-containing protein [Dimargaris cristalligena]